LIVGRQQLQEVFLLNTNTKPDHDEAQEILDALRKIQQTPELREAAKSNPESVVNRLGLSDVARHAVAFGIAGLLVGGPVAGGVHLNGWWAG
jgi:hypothetical protein